MIVWKGLGILVGVAGLLGFIVAAFVIDAIAGSDFYYQTHVWPKLVGASTGAAFSFLAARFLEKGDKPRVVIDKETGHEIILRRGDELFFLPVRFWPYIFLIVGSALAFNA